MGNSVFSVKHEWRCSEAEGGEGKAIDAIDGKNSLKLFHTVVLYVKCVFV